MSKINIFNIPTGNTATTYARTKLTNHYCESFMLKYLLKFVCLLEPW